MKKMQCEVCGGSDLMKLDEDLFVCRSCGVQYTKAEAQKLIVEFAGPVVIDRAAELENMLVRAEQSLEEGDEQKAVSYYEKALDIDPENAQALEGKASILRREAENAKHRQQEEAARRNAVELIPQEISKEEALSSLLGELRRQPHLAGDLFREFKLIGAEAAYFPVRLLQRELGVHYTATACYVKEVPYTDYVWRTDYSSKDARGNPRKYQEAVTKYRKEIERQPVSGDFTVKDTDLSFVSEPLAALLTALPAEDYDKNVTDTKTTDETGAPRYGSHPEDALPDKLEQHLNLRIGQLIDLCESTPLPEDQTLNGLRVHTQGTDSGWYTRGTQRMNRKLKEKRDQKLKQVVPGDYCENGHTSGEITASTEMLVYLPMLAVEYAYRGSFYRALVLLRKDGAIFFTFPYDETADRTARQENLKNRAIGDKKRKSAGYTAGMFLTSFGVTALLMPLIFFIQGEPIGESLPFFLPIAAVLMLPGILLLVSSNKKQKRATIDLHEQTKAALNRVESARTDALQTDAAIFLSTYKQTGSLDEAAAAVKASPALAATDLSQVRTGVATADGKPLGTNETASPVWLQTPSATLDQNGKPLEAGQTYRLRIGVGAQTAPSDLHALRTLCGVGLAQAKTMLETPGSVAASGLTADNAAGLAEQLRRADIPVTIEKEDAEK